MSACLHTAATERRFSNDDSAKKWNDMYAGTSRRLDQVKFRRRRDITIEHVLRLLPPGGRVLDLGCGAAPVLSELRRRGIQCTGLDLTQDMLEHARERLRAMNLDDSDLHQGNCCHTPFPDASFDIVVCLGVVSYVEHYEDALAEIQRLLKPGGHALISLRNRFNLILSDPVRLTRHLVKVLAGHLEPEPYTIGRFMDPREFEEKVRRQGFHIHDFHGIGFGPFRFRGRALFSERTRIRIDAALTRLFGANRSGLPHRWLADVSLWVVATEPAATRQRIDTATATRVSDSRTAAATPS